MKIYYAGDVHGSEKCWRKFLNAAKFYEVDTLVMGGDITGKVLRDGFLPDIAALTFGFVSARNNSFYLGPIELLRFGPARVTKTRVEWPIEGGLLARAPGQLAMGNSGGTGF